LEWLIKLKQLGTIEEFTSTFKQLAIFTEGMSNTLFRELFIIGLKEEIYVQVLMACSITWFEASPRAKKAQKLVNSQIKRATFIPHPHPTIPPVLIPLLPLHPSIYIN
jgi:hypothetical protein